MESVWREIRGKGNVKIMISGMPHEAVALEGRNDGYRDNDCGCMEGKQVWMAKLCIS